MTTLDVIAFAAHPDDAEAACGGTLLKLGRRNYSVAICDLTRGELGSNGSVSQREREATAAAQVLEVRERLQLDLPDGGLHATDAAQLLAVVRTLRARAPRLVIAPHESSRHPDHAATTELVRRAQFFSGVRKFDADTWREGFQRPVWIRALDYHGLEPSFVVDISDELETKMRAIRCYVSQFERTAQSTPTILNDPAYLRRIETNARTYGQTIGCAAGEPFVVEGGVPIDDPVAVWAPGKPGVRA